MRQPGIRTGSVCRDLAMLAEEHYAAAADAIGACPRVKVPPAAREQLIEQPAVNPEHHGGRVHFGTIAGARISVRASHLHAVDNGKEVATGQAVEMDCFAQRTSEGMPRPPCMKQRNFTAPVG
ncbi:MAG TPA: hypothetical protein VHT21_07800 [Stellaceae bacterium]|nr:hypothetical protein [Stellaceae bacterium]